MVNVASVSRVAPRRAGWVLAILCGVYVGAASDWFAAHHHQHTLQLALYALTPCYIIAIFFFCGSPGCSAATLVSPSDVPGFGRRGASRSR